MTKHGLFVINVIIEFGFLYKIEEVIFITRLEIVQKLIENPKLKGRMIKDCNGNIEIKHSFLIVRHGVLQFENGFALTIFAEDLSEWELIDPKFPEPTITVKEAFKELLRLCMNFKLCYNCPLKENCNNNSSKRFEDINITIQIIENWAKNNPEVV